MNSNLALTSQDVTVRLNFTEWLIREALAVEGEDYKQYYLQEIAHQLGVDVRGTSFKAGVAPDGIIRNAD